VHYLRTDNNNNNNNNNNNSSCARGNTICLRSLQVDNIYLGIYSPGGTCSGMLAI